MITQAAIEEMREWLLQITFRDADQDDIESADNFEILDAVERCFEGGVKGFLATI